MMPPKHFPIALIVCGLVSAAAYGQELPEPESSLATATKQYERNLLEAERAFLKGHISARIEYREAIVEAKRNAHASGNVELVRRLRERDEKIEKQLKRDRTYVERITHQLAEDARVTVRGDGFAVKVLRNNATAYSNRDYQWQNVPRELEGWKYTQIKGGDTPDFHIEVLQDGIVYVMAESDVFVEDKWISRPKLSFRWYPKRPLMSVFSRQVKAGQVIDISHVGWTGTLALMPPTSSPKYVSSTTK